MALPEFSIVAPVYNEAENIRPFLRGIERAVRGNYEILVVYDFDEDTTLGAIAQLDPPVERVRLVKNTLGPGVTSAIRAGFAASKGFLGVVVTMADLSDPPEGIIALTDGLRAGCDVVAGSRYMKGGQQVGGPTLKMLLSRLAGLGAYWLTGIGIHDVTNSFRAYSRRLIESTPVESVGGFAVGIELTIKCHLRGWPVGEVPVTWHHRAAGASRFQLVGWLPNYLLWYRKLLLGDPFGLSPTIRRARRAGPKPAGYQFFGVYDKPHYGWITYRYKPGVVIVALTEDEKLVMIRVHRPYHGAGQSDWEFPGGAVETTESVLESARRELVQETGYRTPDPGTLIEKEFEPAPGMGSYPHRVVVFRGCTADGEAPEPFHEGIGEVSAFTAGEVADKIVAGEVSTLPTIAGFYLFRTV